MNGAVSVKVGSEADYSPLSILIDKKRRVS
jgi:hypothetical protein